VPVSLQVAAAVGIPAEDVHASIKPAGKAALVEKLKGQVRVNGLQCTLLLT
jgi:cation transport ATPase